MCSAKVCVSGVEVGASVGATPPSYCPLPLKSCIKEMGAENHLCHFALRLWDNHTLAGHTNTLDTRIPRAHSDYPEKGGTSVCWILPWWALWLDWKIEEERHSWTTLSNSEPVRIRTRRTPQTLTKIPLPKVFTGYLQPSHEDLQPALPAPAARSCCSTNLLIQTR